MAKFNKQYCVLVGGISVLLFLVFIITTPGDLSKSPFQDIGEGEIVDTSTPTDVHTDETSPEGKYSYLVVINSDVVDHSRRKLLRETIFGIKDNLIHCLEPTSSVQHRFLVRNDPSLKTITKATTVGTKYAARRYATERMEFDDIDELPNVRGDKWIEQALTLAKKNYNFDFLIYTDIFTVLNIPKIKQSIESLDIPGYKSSPSELDKLFWGPFKTVSNRSTIIVGSNALTTILKQLPQIKSLHGGNLLTKIYRYYKSSVTSKKKVITIADDTTIVDWENTIYNLPDDVLAVNSVYQNGEVTDITNYLSISPSPPCNLPSTRLSESPTISKPSVAVITSSFVYTDLCMLAAAPISADNKRLYAKKHGYSFVPRSLEFAQQGYTDRKTVWGKIDAVEKVLPLYDWLFWLDMDAVIFNFSTSIESLLEKFEKQLGKREFKKKHLIVAKPMGDSMINAGVFLLRNSEWSKKFIREVQMFKSQYRGKFYEQAAMWKVMITPEWEEGVLLLDDDDHTFNTFPSRYEPGDFVVHYAPQGCPGKLVIRACEQAIKMDKDPDASYETVPA
ncbi:3195_t:CDS:2 [Paraglomus occultum]|uniref:3195_t:CDS:1 n=1 Tax=Paraglomus occultum TaxID=144539 RepID=A0A9N8ZSR5_9GLOM|nr:3195_t:CDS:2 [Paraglomus occultum]